MIAVQSSASICSAREVEPTTSAKSAVTTLRSPARRAARIFAASGAGAAAARRVRRASSVGVLPTLTAWPQLIQNRAPAGNSVLQLLQRCTRGVPQLRQNLACGGLSCAQLEQIIASPFSTNKISATSWHYLWLPSDYSRSIKIAGPTGESGCIQDTGRGCSDSCKRHSLVFH